MVDYVGGNLDQGTPIDHIRVPHEGPAVNGVGLDGGCQPWGAGAGLRLGEGLT